MGNFFADAKAKEGAKRHAATAAQERDYGGKLSFARRIGFFVAKVHHGHCWHRTDMGLRHRNMDWPPREHSRTNAQVCV